MKRIKNLKPKPIALTDRDKAIIISVYENRFLRRDQIQRLFFTDTSLPACNMRLKKLYDHYFLDRLFKPVAVGSSQAVYALNKRGADLVAQILEIDRYQVNWKRDHNRVEFLFLEHTLAVSEFMVNLDLALALSTSANLFFYRRGDKSLVTRVPDPTKKKKYLLVAPDAFFGLSILGNGKSYFFLEVDMGTETLTRFAEKIIAYKQFWKSGKYTDIYGYKHFRVLTIAESGRRLMNLIEATKKAGGKSMFLFTTFSQIEKQSVLGRVWQSPLPSKPISLLE